MLNKNFLLTTPLAVRLYNDCAKGLALIDYHNHLVFEDVAENKNFENITQLWIVSDPYKLRAMRMCGVAEELITGKADDYQKFSAWCSIFPRLIGNPLYYWSLMELETIFGIEEKPNEHNAKRIWDETNAKLRLPEYTARNIYKRFKIEYCAPCCSIISDISAYKDESGIAPSLRGDDLIFPNISFIETLENSVGVKINALSDLSKAISQRLDAFHAAGCRFSDHAIDDGFTYKIDDGNNEERFLKILNGDSLNKEDSEHIASALLLVLGSEYAKRNWVMQLHIGALRYTSTRLRQIAGAAGGYAGIGNNNIISDITKFLDDLEQKEEGLPRTVLFTINPAQNAALSVLSGSYSKDGVSGLVQQGPAWWWCDNLLGIREVLDVLSTYGVLSNFIGMTTDSRSLLSLVRHDYFRRVLCGWIGEKVLKDEFPNDYEELKTLITNICYTNVKNILLEGDNYEV